MLRSEVAGGFQRAGSLAARESAQLLCFSEVRHHLSLAMMNAFAAPSDTLGPRRHLKQLAALGSLAARRPAPHSGDARLPTHVSEAYNLLLNWGD